MQTNNYFILNNQSKYKQTNKNIKSHSNPISFKGELEVKFFNAMKDGRTAEQISSLNNIGFDVLEKDVNTGDNFLHSVCKNGTQSLFEKALKLLRINKAKASEVINATNNENKTPFDYLNDDTFKNRVKSLFGVGVVASIQPQSAQEAPKEPVFANEEILAKPESSTTSVGGEKVGNEIENQIDLTGFSFEEEQATPLSQEKIKKTGLGAIIGEDAVVKVLNDEIVTPLTNNKNIFTNGFLIHGLSGNGKTYTVEKLAETLGREIVESSKILDLASKDESKLAEAIDKSIIKINTEEPRQIVAIAEILKNNFQNNRKQGLIFSDEIKTFFDEDSRYSAKLNAMQSIENGAQKGIVILATTNNLKSIDVNATTSLRFEKILEVKPPSKEQVKEVIKEQLPAEHSLTDEDINSLSKNMNGLSFNDVTRIVSGTCNKYDNPNMQHFTTEITEYAKLRNITDITEEGTTCNYDTFLKRSQRGVNDPKSLDDVIGMKEVKKNLKQVFGPIKKEKIFADYYKKNKIKKPNGILLYGPPGCGKTYVMSAIAAETKLPLYQVKLSDIGSSYSNQTEKNIKNVFDQLRKKYRETGEASILFFDECDSLFSKNNSNESSVKILNTFKEEMNNAGDDGIYVVAATNEKDNLNTAITRDGRFDVKIEVGYPDEEAREGLISYALTSPALSHIKTPENIKEFTKLTEGLSNSTITGIFSNLKFAKTSEAVDRDIETEQEFNKFLSDSPINYDDAKKSILAKKEEINKMKLKQREKNALEWQQKTSAYDEFLPRIYYGDNDPKSLADVSGMDDVKEEMRLKVLAPLNPILNQYYRDNNIPMSSGIILHGPGGCGKTFIVKAVAAESKIPLYELNIKDQGSSYMNETGKNIKKIFDQLKKKYKETEEHEPSILFLDECDSLLGKVGASGGRGSGANDDRRNTLNILKEELADASNNGIIVIAATNEYGNLDQNVIRSGRFNDHIKIGYPDEKARLGQLTKILSGRKTSEDLSQDSEKMKELVELTDQMSNADIKTIVDNATIMASRDYVEKVLKLSTTSNIQEMKPQVLTLEEMKKAIAKKRAELNELRRNSNPFMGDYDEN